MADQDHDPLARRVTAGLEKLAAVLRTNAWRGAAAAGVTPTQAQALAALRGQQHGLRLAALAQTIGVSAPTASDAVASLVSKGLVSKQPGADKRAVTIALTSAGAEMANQADAWPLLITKAVETLDEPSQAAMLRGLVQIIRALQQGGNITPQRMCATCKFFRPFAHTTGDQPHHCDFVNAPFGDRHLRIACVDHVEADSDTQRANWERFTTPQV